MFNSSVLDVAVGLIFVYLLLGLMCTTVNEWFAQMFNSRAATLREGIRRLLHAPPDGTYLIRPVDINVAALVRRFAKPDDRLTLAVGPLDAAVKTAIDAYAAALDQNPAAPPPPGLASALAEKLSAALGQPDLMRKIDDAKVTPETRAESAKPLKNSVLLRVNRAVLSEAYPDEITSLSDAFYSHPLVKALALPGGHPSYVSANTFALSLIDIFSRGEAAAANAQDRLAQIKASVAALPDSDVKRSLEALMRSGTDSVEHLQKKLEDWFEGAMDRVSGWYKKRMQVWTIIVASTLTILVNADSIRIAQKLMLNPALREKIAQEAAAARTSPPGASADAASSTRPPSTLTAQQKADLASLTGWSDEFRTFHRLVACADQKLRGGISEMACRSQSERQVRANLALASAWNDDSFPGTDLAGPFFFPWLWGVIPAHLSGWILTAIAASLGAPFWFDILNKFMNVRSAGTAPDEKKRDKSKV